MDTRFVGDELESAFWAYESALMTNDVSVLDGAFADDAHTVRSDGGAALVGHQAIAAFRASRPALPPRRVVRLHRRDLGAGTAVLVAETVRAGGGTGVVTQLWRRGPGGWQIVVAHVSVGPGVPVPEVDVAQSASIWRVAPDAGSFPAGTAGPLAGLGVAVKDLYAVAGHAIGGGTPHVLAEQPVQGGSAAAVQALLDEGAYVAGIAHTDELAYSIAGSNRHYGSPYNAAAPGHLTGGSSSGSAAAVAAHLADLGLGTDTAGSIRVPASFCGLWGMRPTHGAVSLAGALPLAPTFDTAGILARRPELLVAAMRVLLPVGSSTRPTRLAVSRALVALADPATALTFDASLRALAGREALTVSMLDDDFTAAELDTWSAAFRRLQACEAWRSHGERIERYAGTFQPEVEARFRAGAETTPTQEKADRELMAAASARVAALLPAGTVLALPATSGPAPSAAAAPADLEVARAATLRLTFLASATGTPVVVLPVGRVGTLPVGLALLGARGTDHELLSLLPTAAEGVEE